MTVVYEFLFLAITKPFIYSITCSPKRPQEAKNKINIYCQVEVTEIKKLPPALVFVD